MSGALHAHAEPELARDAHCLHHVLARGSTDDDLRGLHGGRIESGDFRRVPRVSGGEHRASNPSLKGGFGHEGGPISRATLGSSPAAERRYFTTVVQPYRILTD